MTAVWTAVAKRAWLMPQDPSGPQITGGLHTAGDTYLPAGPERGCGRNLGSEGAQLS